MIKRNSFQLKLSAAIVFAMPLFAGQAFAQDMLIEHDKPVASLSAAFGLVPCGHFLAMSDSLLTDLANNPNSQGYVVFYPQGTSPISVDSRERQLRSQLKMRSFDESRITMVRGSAQVKGLTQFWTAPLGAENPAVKPADPMALASPTKPDTYLFSTSVTEGDNCGLWPLDLKAFAGELIKDAKYGGRIVISETSALKFR